jgi:hypothetical protein
MRAIDRRTLMGAILSGAMITLGLVYGRLYAACNTAGCDEECTTNSGFCSSNTNGFYYSVGRANQFCHPTGTGGTPDTEQNVSKTDIINGSCSRGCTNDGGTTQGNPITDDDSTTEVSTVPVNTKCTKSSG